MGFEIGALGLAVCVMAPWTKTASIIKSRTLAACQSNPRRQLTFLHLHIQSRSRSPDFDPCGVKWSSWDRIESIRNRRLEHEVESGRKVIQSASPDTSASNQPYGDNVEVENPRSVSREAEVQAQEKMETSLDGGYQ